MKAAHTPLNVTLVDPVMPLPRTMTRDSTLSAVGTIETSGLRPFDRLKTGRLQAPAAIGTGC